MTDDLKVKIITWLEKIDIYWRNYVKPQVIKIDRTPPYLKDRIIICGNCEMEGGLVAIDEQIGVKRQLRVEDGSQVCSTCGSHHWAWPTQINFIERLNPPPKKRPYVKKNKSNWMDGVRPA